MNVACDAKLLYLTKKSLLWGIVSKAFEKSKMATSIFLPLSLSLREDVVGCEEELGLTGVFTSEA